MSIGSQIDMGNQRTDTVAGLGLVSILPDVKDLQIPGQTYIVYETISFYISPTLQL